MTKSTTITNTVASTVLLGERGFGDTLTVTGTGLVLPAITPGMIATYGATGLIVRPNVANARITNLGTISGGPGAISGANNAVPGGIGVEIAGADTSISNAGVISGGTDGDNDVHPHTTSYDGGAGINIIGNHATIANSGIIAGGAGASSRYYMPGAGGIGINDNSAIAITNTGTIAGGAGGSNRYYYTGGNGGTALNLGSAEATVINDGLIAGGKGGLGGYSGEASHPQAGNGTSGTGVNLLNGGMLSNYGTITGGTGVFGRSGARITNLGTITGQANSAYNVPLGVEIVFVSNLVNSGVINGGVDAKSLSSISNTGTISGAPGPNYQYGYRHLSENGFAGVTLTHSTLDNAGMIIGGKAGYFSGNSPQGGGIGLVLNTGGSAINNGTITGGEGGFPGYGCKNAGSYLVNNGVIRGGNILQEDGSGGTGLVSFSTAVNMGTIQGGGGAMAKSQYSYKGGVGVDLFSGTLTNFGTISGGLVNGQYGVAAIVGDATLAVVAGATFHGVVQGASTASVLELTGSESGTLTGIGTEYSGFATIEEAGNANWLLNQHNSIGAATSLVVDGTLTVAGTLADAGSVSIRSYPGRGATVGRLQAAANATIQLGNLTMDNGVLGGLASASIDIGVTIQAPQFGFITVESGASITGSGRIVANGSLGVNIVDDGRITAQYGHLTLAAPVLGTGVLSMQNFSILEIGGATDIPSGVFVAGGIETLKLDKPASFSATLSGFSASDTIQLVDISATNMSFANDTLTIIAGSTTDTLTFAGTYTAANFHLSTNGTDTMIDFVPGNTAPTLHNLASRYADNAGPLHWEPDANHFGPLLDWIDHQAR